MVGVVVASVMNAVKLVILLENVRSVKAVLVEEAVAAEVVVVAIIVASQDISLVNVQRVVVAVEVVVEIAF
ncbi:hypothetical protein Mgra_00000052 [Meloidogyne graminicola]|uniref:Uncharacterized protein n=1 Tax=Meloidogyne graminicola TaxID=189291 RepID=A0A8T0A286_9BILA|nr:hypothetical protein Mgra_00000052 [Meloidogyne graminicola]